MHLITPYQFSVSGRSAENRTRTLPTPWACTTTILHSENLVRGHACVLPVYLPRIETAKQFLVLGLQPAVFEYYHLYKNKKRRQQRRGYALPKWGCEAGLKTDWSDRFKFLLLPANQKPVSVLLPPFLALQGCGIRFSLLILDDHISTTIS